MVLVQISVHPRSLGPDAAAKAWFLRKKQNYTLSSIRDAVKNLANKRPSEKAVRNAVARMQRTPRGGIPKCKYANCGRRWGANGASLLLTKKEVSDICAFVKKWRNKKFCCTRYIKAELKLKASLRTIRRTLNRNGYHWRPVPKKQMLTSKDIQSRREFVDRHLKHSPGWWERNLNLVLDGVTLTKAPKTLSGRQKHAAQSITHMWMRKHERPNSDVNTYN